MFRFKTSIRTAVSPEEIADMAPDLLLYVQEKKAQNDTSEMIITIEHSCYHIVRLWKTREDAERVIELLNQYNIALEAYTIIEIPEV